MTEPIHSNTSTIHDAEHDCEPLLNIVQAAQFLNLSPMSLYHFVSARRVPHIKLSNRCLRFRKSSLIQWLDSLSHEPAPPDHSVHILSSSKHRDGAKVPNQKPSRKRRT